MSCGREFSSPTLKSSFCLAMPTWPTQPPHHVHSSIDKLPWAFIYEQGGSRRGPTLRECTLLHAVARLGLYPAVKNIQASWVKMGPERAGRLLSAGCNDMGGVLMNESITKAAGGIWGNVLAENLGWVNYQLQGGMG